MEQPEFLSWIEFFKLYPFDDYHRYYRPAAMVSMSLGGGEIQPRLDWLQPDRSADEMTDADSNTMRAFGYTRKGG